MRIYGLLLCGWMTVSLQAQQIHDWENHHVLQINREPARAAFVPFAKQKGDCSMSLDGMWKFRWTPVPSERIADFYRTDFNDEDWKSFPVPANWEINGYGTPIYVSAGYPFKIDPPRVMGEPKADYTTYKERNPVGQYRRTFVLPVGWEADGQTFLRFEGVMSAFYVWINGERVGYSQGSMEPSEFNITDYEKSAYLLHNSEELNRLIEEELLDYYFQPIVNARTGQVFGYEALMRPRLTSLETPLEVLSLAKSQGKLYQIERLTWFLALKSFTGFKNIPPDCRLFINSIANQGLSESDEKVLEAQYGPYLGSLVVELTEEEERVESYTRKKISFLKRHGGQVALDDFGAGYNGEVSLLAVRPDFIKVDLSIVRNCHQDKNRQEMISNIISFARKTTAL